MTTNRPPTAGPEDLTICVPAFNEAGAIAVTLRSLRERLPQAEIVVVDDGSTDGTGEAATAVEGVTVLRHDRNIGYGASIKTAVRHAHGAVVVWCDADGQHRAEDVEAAAAPVLAGRMDAVLGRRGKGSDVRPRRVPGKILLRAVAEMVARQKIPDLNSGLRAFRRDVLARYLHLLPDGFSASATSTLLMIKRGYRLGFVDIVTHPRIGSSTVRHLRDGFGTLHLILRLLILFEALRFFTIVSLVQVVPALLYGFTLAFMRGQGFPTLAATVFISGVLTFMIGLVCDQITALRQERFEN